MIEVERAHPGDTSDSEAVTCGHCNGTGKNRFGQPCGTANEDQGGCAGTGWTLQQRRDANGLPTRVRIIEAGADSGGTATGSTGTTTTASAGTNTTATAPR